jgi:hypothetical protein
MNKVGRRRGFFFVKHINFGTSEMETLEHVTGSRTQRSMDQGIARERMRTPTLLAEDPHMCLRIACADLEVFHVCPFSSRRPVSTLQCAL